MAPWHCQCDAAGQQLVAPSAGAHLRRPFALNSNILVYSRGCSGRSCTGGTETGLASWPCSVHALLLVHCMWPIGHLSKLAVCCLQSDSDEEGPASTSSVDHEYNASKQGLPMPGSPSPFPGGLECFSPKHTAACGRCQIACSLSVCNCLFGSRDMCCWPTPWQLRYLLPACLQKPACNVPCGAESRSLQTMSQDDGDEAFPRPASFWLPHPDAPDANAATVVSSEMCCN